MRKGPRIAAPVVLGAPDVARHAAAVATRAGATHYAARARTALARLVASQS